MYYLMTDSAGGVASVHRDDPGPGAEFVAADDPRVRAFLRPDAHGGQLSDDVRDDFSRMDLDFVRVLEDVIDALTARNILNITDLPETAQAKLFARKSFRERSTANALRLFQETGFKDDVL